MTILGIIFFAGLAIGALLVAAMRDAHAAITTAYAVIIAALIISISGHLVSTDCAALSCLLGK